MLIVLRASSQDLDLQAILHWLPQERLERTWKPGDRIGRRIRDTYGFSALLAESDDDAMAQTQAKAALSSMAMHLKNLSAAGVSVEADFALYVQAMRPSSFELSRELMELLIAANVRVRVTAYPCADDDG